MDSVKNDVARMEGVLSDSTKAWKGLRKHDDSQVAASRECEILF